MMAPVPERTIGFLTSAAYRNLTADDLVLAHALQRRGVKVVPVVWTEVAPESVACDLLVIRSVWDYHLHADRFLRWVAVAGDKVKTINPPEVVLWNADKRYLKEIEAGGFAIPRTFLLENRSQVDLAALMADAGLNEVVIKPAVSASAYETHRVRIDQAETFGPKLNLLLQDRDMLLQEFVPEIASSGEWSLIFIGTAFAGSECTHAVNKVPRSGDFRVQEEHGGLHRLAEPPAEAVVMAQKILARFAPQAAYCRADMVMRPQGPVLMELELIEPLLHFQQAPQGAEKFADLLMAQSVPPLRVLNE